jgi:hypothetical protein
VTTAATQETERVARSYFEAWTSRDRETTASLLDPGFRFTAGETLIEGRDAFLQAAAFPEDATTTMLDEAYEGEIGFQLYESRRGDRAVLIAERLRVRDGRIADAVSVTDMASFAAFLGPTGGDG